MAVNIFGTDYSLATEGFDITPDVTVLQAANNLSDVGSVATSRTNLGVCSITELGASGGVSIHWDNIDTGNVFSCTNQTNNRIITALSTNNSFNSEDNLTFDGSTLGVVGNITTTGLNEFLCTSNYAVTSIKQTTDTNVIQYPSKLLAYRPSGASASGFGVGLDFNIEDSVSEETLARLYVVRTVAGSDTGTFGINVYNAGAETAIFTANTADSYFRLYTNTLDLQGASIYAPGYYDSDLIFGNTWGGNKTIQLTDNVASYNLTVRPSDYAAGVGGLLQLNGGDGLVGGQIGLVGGIGSTGAGGDSIVAGGTGAGGSTGGNIFVYGGDAGTYGNIYIGDVDLGGVFTSYIKIGDQDDTDPPTAVLDIRCKEPTSTVPLIHIENTSIGTYDSFIRFKEQGGAEYSVGIDDDDNDNFKIYYGSLLGTTALNTGFTFRGSLGRVGIGEPSPLVGLHVTNTYTPAVIIDSTSTSTNTIQDGLQIRHFTTASAADTFGVGMKFNIYDDSLMDRTIGRITVERDDGVDTTGLMKLNVYGAGSAYTTFGIKHDKATVRTPINYCTSATGNDTYVAILDPPLDAYIAGQMFILQPDAANTGACSLNINGIGVLNIKNSDGLDPANGDIIANMPNILVYNGTNLIIISPQATGAP